MSLRKSAVDLQSDEISKFLEAVFLLKANRNSQGISVYDQYVALHGAVMGMLTPTSGGNTVNFAHGNIGFLPWHRQYLRSFEQVLTDALGDDVSIPYWDWSNTIGAANVLFTPDFLCSIRWGSPRSVADGFLQFSISSPQQPPWWPSGLPGFRIDSRLREGLGASLTRGNTEPNWPPREVMSDALVNVDLRLAGRHPLWVFWLIIEQGIGQLPETHNAGHRFIGGHMGGAFSPNDPVFWLHHANIDRLWDSWQQNRISNGLSANAMETYPVASETSPFDGSIAPEGHKVGDDMWPWNGNAPGYRSASVSQAVRNRLPVFGETVKVEAVLDSSSIGVTYQAPL